MKVYAFESELEVFGSLVAECFLDNIGDESIDINCLARERLCFFEESENGTCKVVDYGVESACVNEVENFGDKSESFVNGVRKYLISSCNYRFDNCGDHFAAVIVFSYGFEVLAAESFKKENERGVVTLCAGELDKLVADSLFVAVGVEDGIAVRVAENVAVGVGNEEAVAFAVKQPSEKSFGGFENYCKSVRELVRIGDRIGLCAVDGSVFKAVFGSFVGCCFVEFLELVSVLPLSEVGAENKTDKLEQRFVENRIFAVEEASESVENLVENIGGEVIVKLDTDKIGNACDVTAGELENFNDDVVEIVAEVSSLRICPVVGIVEVYERVGRNGDTAAERYGLVKVIPVEVDRR